MMYDTLQAAKKSSGADHWPEKFSGAARGKVMEIKQCVLRKCTELAMIIYM
jgi:hypothetical protein